jgi:hypothetical protein
MVNFNEGRELPNKFSGSEKKTTLLYDGVVYMIKYPDPIREKNNKLSYMNNHFSEHIGCSIFSVCGFKTQETVLGAYTGKSGKNTIVVGCKDFTQDGSVLYEVAKLANAVATTEDKLGTTIEDVNRILKESDFIKEKEDVNNRFWDMFVIDALLGNKDRHFGNWGLLLKDDETSFAPIYDCGSTLGAILSDERMEELLQDDNEFKRQEYNVHSCYFMGGKKIFYHEIFKTPPDDLKEAIKRTVPKVDMARIENIVLNTEGISETRKTYLNKSLAMRHDLILAPALKRILKAQGLNGKLADAKKTHAEMYAEGTDKPKEKKPSVRDER